MERAMFPRFEILRISAGSINPKVSEHPAFLQAGSINPDPVPTPRSVLLAWINGMLTVSSCGFYCYPG
jgi:hypothetical protein